MFFKNSIFCQKPQNFVHFGQYNLFKISPACGTSTYQIMYGESLPVTVFVTVAQKSFKGKFSAKIEFPTAQFMLPLLTLTSEV